MELRLALLLVLAVARAAGPASVPPPGGAGRTRDPQASPAAGAEGDMKEPLVATAARGGGAARPGQQQGPARLGVLGAPARPRARRCTCLTYKDKECVYYCHLDIIWINTPERTVPYGLSSSRGHFRARRALGLFPQNPQAVQQAQRCTCVDSGDPACARFCAWPAADSRNSRGAEEPPERRKTRPRRSLSRMEQASRA